MIKIDKIAEVELKRQFDLRELHKDFIKWHLFEEKIPARIWGTIPSIICIDKNENEIIVTNISDYCLNGYKKWRYFL
jgi:hypothetical protein